MWWKKKSSNTRKSFEDPFLQQIADEKARTDANIGIEKQQLERDGETLKRELETRYADDVRLKERLSAFARTQELDQALIALWIEAEQCLSHSTWDNYDEWNTLRLAEVRAARKINRERGQTIEFVYGGQRYAVAQRTWTGGAEFENSYADFALWADGEEVFAITACLRDDVEISENYGDYGRGDVAAFKKRGDWAMMLLQCYAQLKVAEAKLDVESETKRSYYGADEIKKRFEE